MGSEMCIRDRVVIALITPISATSAWVLRNDVEKLWQTVLLYVGPIIDAWLVYYLLTWMEMGLFATWGCTISAGIISSILLQPIFSPRRLAVFRYHQISDFDTGIAFPCLDTLRRPTVFRYHRFSGDYAVSSPVQSRFNSQNLY